MNQASIIYYVYHSTLDNDYTIVLAETEQQARDKYLSCNEHKPIVDIVERSQLTRNYPITTRYIEGFLYGEFDQSV